MSKSIRIENADTSDHKVVVEVWEGGDHIEPKKINEIRLDYPTALTTQLVYKGQFLVIREV
jgi:hypothetical protein